MVFSVRWLILLVAVHLSPVTPAADKTDPTYTKLYYDVKAFSSCFRRFNGTHEIGCSTNMYGNVGVLHSVDNAASLTWLIENGPHKPYIPFIKSSLFTRDNVKRLIASNKLNGLIINFANNTDSANYPSEGFSPDKTCPNEVSDIYADDGTYGCDNHQYNADGSNLMFEDLDFPMMVMWDTDEIETLSRLIRETNLPSADGSPPQYPLSAAELKSYMHGAGNTEVCVRRNGMIRNFSPDHYCDPLGGRSSVAILGNSSREGSPRANRSVVLITARIDSFSLFHLMMPGAGTPVPALTALLAVVEATKPFVDLYHAAGKDVMFALLTGESFDYIGSQRLVYDMGNGDFPNITSKIELKHIDLIIELSDLIEGLASGDLYAHTDPLTRDNHLNIQTFIDELTNVMDMNVTVSAADLSLPLPPSSAQMFIRELATGVPAVVVGDYNAKFKSKFYNSFMDTAASINLPPGSRENVTTPQARFLANVASTVATAIHRYILPSSSETLTAKDTTTQSIIYCLLVDRECDLFYSVIEPAHVANLEDRSIYSFYVGVYSAYGIDGIQNLVHALLFHYAGDVMDDWSEEECIHADDPDWYYLWVNGPGEMGNRTQQCVRSPTQFINSTSPAFSQEDYDFTSTHYSTWTESVWPGADPFHIKVFHVPSRTVQYTSLFTGLAIFIISLPVMFLINRNSMKLFPPHDGLVINVNADT